MTEIYNVIGVDTENPASASNHKLGEIAHGGDGTIWVYVDAEAAITQYHAVEIDEDYKASPLTTANLDKGYRVGFAQAAFNSGQKGWVVLSGSNVNVLVAASCNADVALFATSTAGVLDDAGATASDRVDGVVAIAGSTTGTAKAVEVIATYPQAISLGSGT